MYCSDDATRNRDSVYPSERCFFRTISKNHNICKSKELILHDTKLGIRSERERERERNFRRLEEGKCIQNTESCGKETNDMLWDKNDLYAMRMRM